METKAISMFRNRKLFHTGASTSTLQLVVSGTVIPSVMNQVHECGHLGTRKALEKVRNDQGSSTMLRMVVGPVLEESCRCRLPEQIPLQCVAKDMLGPIPQTSKGLRIFLW